MNIRDLLKRVVTDELSKEGITPELLDQVDLEVTYSPVLPFPGDAVDAAVSVCPWGFVAGDALPEKFEVMHPLVRSPTTHDELKIMRARYLLARDEYYGHHLPLALGVYQP